MLKIMRFSIVGLWFTLILAACSMSTSADAGYTTIREAMLKPGDQVPAPTGPVVLTLTGKIGTTNADGRLDFDMETLERLKLVEFKVNDPHLKRSAVYQGVLLKQLLEVAQVPATATTLHTIALNDYKVNVPTEVAHKWPVIVATKRDGARMPVADKGPLEIIFPYDSFNIDPVAHNDQWVWQLRSMEVR